MIWWIKRFGQKWWIWQKISQSLLNIQMSWQRSPTMQFFLPELRFWLLLAGSLVHFYQIRQNCHSPRGLFCHLIWIFTKPMTNFHQIRHFYQIHHLHQLHHFIVIVHWLSKQRCLNLQSFTWVTCSCSELKGLGKTWIPSGEPNDSFLLNTNVHCKHILGFSHFGSLKYILSSAIKFVSVRSC